MASPDKIKNSQLLGLIADKLQSPWVSQTMPQAITTTTIVLMAVARFESTPSIPTLANIEVSAANMAESKAKINHIFPNPFPVLSLSFCISTAIFILFSEIP